MMRKIFAMGSALLLLCLCNGISAVPDGFEDTEVIRSISFLTKITFTPDGHKMLVSLKRGTILVFNDPDGDWSFDNRSIALEFPEDMLCFNGERGVQTIELHPDFTNNRLVYIYYNFPKHGNCDEDDVDGPVNRLSTFYFGTDDTINLASEVVLFETPPSLESFHNGGDIWMGKDGMLYVTIGEGGRKEVSQDPSNLLGAMVRITPDGDIPDDNPFSSVNREMSARCNVTGYLPTDTPDGFKCQEIYAIGLRNPFRFAMDPNTSGNKVRYYINDVGASTWEEINEGGHDFAGPDRIVNYGYPEREGPCRHGRTSGCDGDTNFEYPIHYYQHDNGGACTAGAFIPNGLWPDEYNNGVRRNHQLV
jgi:glucose/arabinose dehydrogenase